MTDVADQFQHPGQQHIDVDNDSVGTHDGSPDQKKQDAELAERLSSIIEGTNERVIPLCNLIRKVGILPCYVNQNNLDPDRNRRI
jgi:hypothetical protein